MRSLRRALPPLVVAAADLGVGGLLYREVSAILGLLLLVCGLSVLIAVAYDPLKRGGSVLWRRVSELTAE
ncbi:MAG: hypothetical protein V5A62_12860 [Haloarculaceae archaeon]